MRTRLLTTTIVLTLLLALASLPAFAGQVEVCHIPNNNPENWHTITVSPGALAAHLAHGDFEGSCAANCEALCDDDNACTQDVESDFAACICKTEPTPVDCDDSNPCTVDGCNAEFGCTYDPDPQNGETCDDGDSRTSDDVCLDGVCGGTACYECGGNDPCEIFPPFTQFGHCDRQLFISCTLLFGCRVIDCGDGRQWNQDQQLCVPIP